jgi:aryl-phospho-beta-D-glucosidase BglC (GH1 family)
MEKLLLATAITLVLCGARTPIAAGDSHWLQVSPEKLPRWRGFNLLEKFSKDWANGPFHEEDFRLISELGFNFVRLPMDYRTWIKDGDWRQFNEAVFREIDQAVEWGARYGVHVCINFHRAPGYTVAEPKESTDLWTDPEAQRVCASHWAFFARRYKGIPNERLSFNLVNEPPEIDGETYARFVKTMAEAIGAEDPDRLIIADGLQWGRTPCPELIPLEVAQATRGYTPMEITHYKASWVAGGMDMAEPVWPLPDAPGFLYGPMQPDYQSPMVIEGDFDQALTLRLHVGTVSNRARLAVKAGEEFVFEKLFECGPGEGEWREAVYKAEWGIYLNTYERDYAIHIPAGTHRIEAALLEGDWLTLTEVGLRPAGRDDVKESVLPLRRIWGVKQTAVQTSREGATLRFITRSMVNQAWLWEQCVKPWQALEAQGVGVVVGEWGAHNKTPHSTALRWMEDCLKNWREAGWGWALWNFRGSFGVLDSEREDVAYEAWRGHKLDREMLDLLQKY